MANEVRTALITHGKGEGRTDAALLKSCVNYWLPQLPGRVLAFHTAQKTTRLLWRHLCVVKKSEQQKQLTREQFTVDKWALACYIPLRTRVAHLCRYALDLLHPCARSASAGIKLWVFAFNAGRRAPEVVQKSHSPVRQFI